jgi:hypothetical protein
MVEHVALLVNLAALDERALAEHAVYPTVLHERHRAGLGQIDERLQTKPTQLPPDWAPPTTA